MKAVCLVREPPHYRRDAFLAGLSSAGFAVVHHLRQPGPGDLLVIWNRYGRAETEARRFEAAGAAVIVAENGYIGFRSDEHAKPFAADGDQLYALALWHHNGAGKWWVGEPGRWRQQGIEVRPWRTDGEHVLVLPQRGIGPDGVRMPDGWTERTVRRLAVLTERPVRVRTHPGNVPARKALTTDLDGAWCAVTWGSGAAIKAICAGVPVFCEFPQWIGMPAAFPFNELSFRAEPWCNDAAREVTLDCLSYAQWTTGEISTGEPFRRLMSMYETQAYAA